MIHELKSQDFNFRMLSHGKKVEIRKNDRNFQVGDMLILRHWIQLTRRRGEYTGRRRIYWITHIERFPRALVRGYVALSLGRIPKAVNPC